MGARPALIWSAWGGGVFAVSATQAICRSRTASADGPARPSLFSAANFPPASFRPFAPHAFVGPGKHRRLTESGTLSQARGARDGAAPLGNNCNSSNKLAPEAVPRALGLKYKVHFVVDHVTSKGYRSGIRQKWF